MIFHGAGVNWGIATNIQYAIGLFQTREHNIISKSETITDGGDTSVSKLYWDFREEASFTYVATFVDLPSGTITPAYPGIGIFVNVTDTNYPAIDSRNYAFAGFGVTGQWLVDLVSTNTSNTSATRVTLKLSRYPYIQNV